MQILCLGLSHHTAPVELRERLNYAPPALKAALARIGCGHDAQPQGIAELAILSTCNRLELYAAVAEDIGADAAFEALLGFLLETRDVPAAELDGKLYRLAGQPAIEHLGRVAAGLDSMILGEPQILGQVTEAYQIAMGQGAAGPLLAALFRSAIEIGKRARSETRISRNPATISSVAVKLAEQAAGDLAASRVLVVGAGEVAELAVEALRARGAGQITVVNRTHARAAQLAERWGAHAVTFERLPETLAQADIVITSTDAPHFVITLDVAAEAMARRPGRPLAFIDIAVPRDVDPAAGQIPNVHYADIDDLQSHLNGALAARQQAVPQVERIVAEETRVFLDWLHGLEITPLIADLRAKAHAIRKAEVEKRLRRMPHLGAAERQHIEALAEALVNKLLHDPTLRLKASAGNGHAAEYASAVRYLFDLNT